MYTIPSYVTYLNWVRDANYIALIIHSNPSSQKVVFINCHNLVGVGEARAQVPIVLTIQGRSDLHVCS